MSKSKKSNKKHSGAPQAVKAQEPQEEKKAFAQPQGYKSDKPLFLRIIMLAIAAAMILSIVVGAVSAAAGM